MRASGGTMGLAAMALLVLGAAGGYAARLGTEREPRRDELDLAARLGELHGSLATLQESVALLGRRQEAAASPTAAREPLRPDPTLDLTALRALVERFERAAASASATVSRGLEIPARRAEPIPPDPQDDAAEEALRRRFELMTYQQVLDVLGRPDEVYLTSFGSNDAVLWSFARDTENDDSFALYFADGLVVHVSP